uniref:Macrophage-expressed gene 1 protein n=1 Tax=Panagrolaimus sp. ES5 TaxID=591445 RepID=A0AC34FTC9_9BILA
GSAVFAQYKSESLINDYGTHIINKAQAGGRVILRTFVTFSDVKEKKSKSIAVSASVSAEGFGVKASVSGGGGSTNAQETEDKSYTRETFIITKGGPDIDRLLSPSEGDSELKMDSLVGLKEEGVFLYSMIHPGILEGYEDGHIQVLHELIFNATVQYYSHNTIPGCTDPLEENYNYRVRPECANFNHVNPYTNSDECPPGYVPQKVKEFYIDITNRNENGTKKNCDFPYSIFGCQTTVVEYPIRDVIKITSFWCKSEAPEIDLPDDPVAMFGGIFEVDNIFSDDVGCPVGFSAYPFLHSLKICMAKYNKKLVNSSVAFGGMFQCRDVVQESEKGFSKYLAATIDGCSYHYCARVLCKSGLTTLPKLCRPPYTDREAAMSQTRMQYKESMKLLTDKLEEEKKKKSDQLKPGK